MHRSTLVKWRLCHCDRTAIFLLRYLFTIIICWEKPFLLLEETLLILGSLESEYNYKYQCVHHTNVSEIHQLVWVVIIVSVHEIQERFQFEGSMSANPRAPDLWLTRPSAHVMLQLTKYWNTFKSYTSSRVETRLKQRIHLWIYW